jgi:hypothetical protein
MYTYTNDKRMIGVPGTPLSLAAVAVVGGSSCPIGTRPTTIAEFGVTVTTAITVTAVIASLLWRPDPASATGQVDLGAVTIPVSTPIGTVVRKKITPKKVGPGGFLVLSVTQAATTGAGYGHVIEHETSDAPENMSNFVESA